MGGWGGRVCPFHRTACTQHGAQHGGTACLDLCAIRCTPLPPRLMLPAAHPVKGHRAAQHCLQLGLQRPLQPLAHAVPDLRHDLGRRAVVAARDVGQEVVEAPVADRVRGPAARLRTHRWMPSRLLQCLPTYSAFRVPYRSRPSVGQPPLTNAAPATNGREMMLPLLPVSPLLGLFGGSSSMDALHSVARKLAVQRVSCTPSCRSGHMRAKRRGGAEDWGQTGGGGREP